MTRKSPAKRMKISFVIPAHDEERYIARSLESILREIELGKHDAEVIVVNNASTDGTEAAARAFPGVRVVREDRKGTSFARMAGFLASKGDLVATVDADTSLSPGWVETALAEFERRNEVVALSGPCIYDVSAVMKIIIQWYFYALYAVYLVQHRLFGGSAILLGGNFIARREALLTIGGYNTDLTFYGDDPYLAKQLAKVGIVKFTFRLLAETSARRFRVEGIVKTGALYVINYFWILLFDRPFTRHALHVRFAER